jgi:Leucine-rich repeat (LRR) protein
LITHSQELVLDRNRIRYIDPDAFVGLPRLRELHIEENGLRSLANLQYLTSLQVWQGR